MQAVLERLRSELGTTQLVAVSKTKPLEMILEAYRYGQRVFGENYVQELIEKATAAPDDIEWHFIGHLQSNKVTQVAGIRSCVVQTVDSLRLAERLNAAREPLGLPLRVMIQINTSGEATKSGCAPADALELASAVSKLPYLELIGLMTIGAPGDGGTSFDTLVASRNEISVALAKPLKLSMGMSGDYLLAVQKGADYVRIGTAIFGERGTRV
ncbi:Alanine racemase [Giardia muris]|uniref:Pyridoxal phosphate homeostasis protein n=1 Tax=Giardia muris TaxID=5742 RepID=A0A4Z1TBQ3_GIAMU|nr:Alanine racemase [Giardia muris]|eukprot:TNJ29959.1 Alanine racemase [Giardia muris]